MESLLIPAEPAKIRYIYGQAGCAQVDLLMCVFFYMGLMLAAIVASSNHCALLARKAPHWQNTKVLQEGFPHQH